jgi:hypothetical protein
MYQQLSWEATVIYNSADFKADAQMGTNKKTCSNMLGSLDLITFDASHSETNMAGIIDSATTSEPDIELVAVGALTGEQELDDPIQDRESALRKAQVRPRSPGGYPPGGKGSLFAPYHLPSVSGRRGVPQEGGQDGSRS